MRYASRISAHSGAVLLGLLVLCGCSSGWMRVGAVGAHGVGLTLDGMAGELERQDTLVRSTAAKADVAGDTAEQAANKATEALAAAAAIANQAKAATEEVQAVADNSVSKETGLLGLLATLFGHQVLVRPARNWLSQLAKASGTNGTATNGTAATSG